MTPKVLLVDDIAEAREILGLKIKNTFDVDIFQAESSAEAIALILIYDFHSVVCDLEMPGGTGLLVREHLDSSLESETAFILFSGNCDLLSAEIRDEMIAISKPDIGEVLDVLKMLGLPTILEQ